MLPTIMAAADKTGFTMTSVMMGGSNDNKLGSVSSRTWVPHCKGGNELERVFRFRMPGWQQCRRLHHTYDEFQRTEISR